MYPNWHMAVQGFPPRDVLRTVYVEHDIDASEAETPVVDFVFADKALQGARPLLADTCHPTLIWKNQTKLACTDDTVLHRACPNPKPNPSTVRAQRPASRRGSRWRTCWRAWALMACCAAPRLPRCPAAGR